MRQFLMAAVALSLCGSALAQSTVSAYENSSSSARKSAGSNQANTELLLMIERLRRQVSDLQGDIEEQRHKLQQLTSQSRDRYIDLDQRLLELSRNQPETQAADSGDESQGQNGGESGNDKVQKTREYRAPTAEEKADYDKIQTLIRQEKDYDAAIDRLYSFISKYPEGDFTVNAYYWLGEVYLAKSKLQQARQAFSIVATRYADHRKAADALYKLGVAEARLGNKGKAEELLKSVPEKFPGSNAAGLAEDYLREL